MIKKLHFEPNETDKIHFKSLKEKIIKELANLPKERKVYAKFRAIIFPVIYVFIYLISTKLYSDNVLFIVCYGFMGMTSVLIFLNMVHEAVHDNIFNKRKYNRLILYFFDLMGSNSYIWKKRHLRMHHSYQNIAGWDSDIEQASLFKIYPHDKKKKFHSFQHFLMFLFYPLYLVNWVFIRDFKDFFRKNQVVRKVINIPRIEYVKLFAFKFLFIFYTVIIPIMNGVSVVIALSAMLLMIIVAGVFALVILLTPHANITNQFPLPNDKGSLSSSWLKHQFVTTNDVVLNKWIGNNLLGNFNFHLVHHLFPRISYVFAPELSQVIKNYANDQKWDYRSYTMQEALKYHYDLIIKNARGVETDSIIK